jgi:hypothetical protein
VSLSSQFSCARRGRFRLDWSSLLMSTSGYAFKNTVVAEAPKFGPVFLAKHDTTAGRGDRILGFEPTQDGGFVATEGIFSVELKYLGDVSTEAILKELVCIPEWDIETAARARPTVLLPDPIIPEKNDSCHALLEYVSERLLRVCWVLVAQEKGGGVLKDFHRLVLFRKVRAYGIPSPDWPSSMMLAVTKMMSSFVLWRACRRLKSCPMTGRSLRRGFGSTGSYPTCR